MELGLSLGDAAKPFVFMEKPPEAFDHLGLGLNTTLSIGPNIISKSCEEEEEEEEAKQKENHSIDHHQDHDEATNDPFYPTVQLDLLPHIPVVARNINPPSQISLPWLSPSQNGEAASSRVLNVNRLLPVAKEAAREEESEETAAVSWSPPNSGATSSFQMDLCIYSRGGSMSGGKRESDGEAPYYDQRASSRASDEDDNNGGSTRKKLRLSKEQSAFLEESFKEHHTLNPKQKQALAKQLNLRPRQVEVWFQNRRARTKLKQTEVDCEYLKRCCETLSEENRRLHKELQELRALKTNSNPFFMQLPATTLTMCPSCERVASNPTSSSSATPSSIATTKSTTDSTSKAIGFPLGKKPMFYPFVHSQPHQSNAS